MRLGTIFARRLSDRKAVGRLIGVTVVVTSLAHGPVACSLGPRIIPMARAEYGQAIHRSAAEQLLTNLIQLRYRESPSMLDLTQIVSQFQFDGSASVGATLQSGASQLPLSIAGSIRETPTVTYVPVTGQRFAIRMLTPLHPYQIFLMSRSGWDLRRLMVACVEEINGLENLSTSVGFVPKSPPPSLDTFVRVTVLMEELEIADVLETVAITTDHPGTARSSAGDASALEGIQFEMLFRDRIGDPAIAKKAEELKLLLHLDPSRNRFPILPVLEQFSWQRGSIAIQTRSMLSVMLFLAGGIEIPEEDRPVYALGAGAVEVDGAPSERGPGAIFDVHVSVSRPKNAAVAVQVRDHWYWIADDDSNSKTSFALVGYLLRLQEAREGGGTPGVLLTIPTG
jgi:hypothetical protein